MKSKIRNLLLAVFLCFFFGACGSVPADADISRTSAEDSIKYNDITVEEIPDFFGEPYVVLDGNLPDFTAEDETFEAFEYYSELDYLGRCQTAYANICRELMPTEEREPIGMVKPSGWQTAKYEFVDGKYLYNRCHLIGYQLAGENANEKNLITGTRYMNVEGMLPFENQIAEYVKESENHVLYRVTPVFDGDDLVASGVEMEAWSVEDEGDGVCFHVYVYNVQPGVVIDYATGDNWLSGEDGAENVSAEEEPDKSGEEAVMEYVLNTNTHKFHLPSCDSASDTKPQNRAAYTGTRSELIDQGYSPCGRCNP